MKYLFFFILTFSCAITAFGQIFKRQEHETAEMFVKRFMPDTTQLAHPVIETAIWNTTPKAIIALYGYDDSSDMNTGFNRITGHLYFPVNHNTYRDIYFGPIEEDGGYPEILSVFFANADQDKAKELFVLCKYNQRHNDYSGEFYETFIFDNPTRENRLAYFEKLSQIFGGCECSSRDGKVKTAKYKTAKSVKAGLLKMGYKQ